MKKIYFLSYLFCMCLLGTAQETVNLAGYDGIGFTVVATSTVNESITIVFEDVDIINNFYTQFQDNIWMYGGLDTDAGGFQGAPADFGNLSLQPQLSLADADNNAAPNSYSITINLAQHYSDVANGTMVYGCNLLFQNQFGGGGNNQTIDMYIDLADALKDSTLSVTSFDTDANIKMVNDVLFVNNYQGKLKINTYDISGRLLQSNDTVSDSNGFTSELELSAAQLYFITVEGDTFVKTLKVMIR